MRSLSDSDCCSKPVSHAAVEEDGTSGLVVEVFDDLDKVGADVRAAPVALLQRFLMTWIRLVLMLYFFMVAHKAACQTLSKAMKTW